MKTRTLAFLASAALLAPSANAGFHLFDIQEVYSNADGSVQFIELFTPNSGQQVVNNLTITLQVATTAAVLNTFTFPNANGPSPTTNKTYLIGTANLSTLYGVTPDYILPADFLQVGTGFSNKRINFAGGTDIVNLFNLPLDGIGSLDGLTTNVGTTAAATAVNSQATPKNFAGSTATIPEPVATGLLGLGILAFLQRRRRA